jgi:D-lactate dehydrogenase (cytochrome)
MDLLWSARKGAVLCIVAAKPKDAWILGTDVAVPISRMADIIGACHATITA